MHAEPSITPAPAGNARHRLAHHRLAHHRLDWRIMAPVAAMIALAAVSVVFSLNLVSRESDRGSILRQATMVRLGIEGTVDQLSQEQEVIAIWDDVVAQARRPVADADWLDENVGGWMHRLFHHDEVYILRPDNRPLYASIEGERLDPKTYQAVESAIAPLVRRVRGQTFGAATRHERLKDRPLHPQSQLRTSNRSSHSAQLALLRGRPAAVSVMAVSPHSDQLRADAPGHESLLVNVRYLDGQFLKEFGERTLISSPRFGQPASRLSGEQATPLTRETGEILGYLIWKPELPGRQMLRVLGPAAAATLGLFVLVMALMAWVLLRSQRRLDRSLSEAVEQRRQAEIANLAKSDFLATISHEIRTPMNAVVSAAHFLGQSTLDESQTGHLNMLQEANSVLLSLLNDVLDLSRIEAGKLSLDLTPVDLIHEVKSVAALWEPRAIDKNLTLEVNFAEDLPDRLMVDQLRVKQILFNLLSNAIKFTETGGVTLRLSCDGADHIAFDVTDSGMGISPNHLERIFGAFEQAENHTARRFGGSGLGLAISRRLSELMGGSLTAQSIEGKGSTFRLRLPLIEAESRPSTDSEHPDKRISVEGLRVLVAEDHPVNRRIVQLLLEPAGVLLTFANDGVEAVEAAGVQLFDAILMDMQMPRMDGVEATQAIRKGGPNAGTPVIALTANAMPQHRAAWQAVGVETLVSKPIDPGQLAAALVAAVDLRPSQYTAA